jgi:hypothetical protein
MKPNGWSRRHAFRSSVRRAAEMPAIIYFISEKKWFVQLFNRRIKERDFNKPTIQAEENKEIIENESNWWLEIVHSPLLFLLLFTKIYYEEFFRIYIRRKLLKWNEILFYHRWRYFILSALTTNQLWSETEKVCYALFYWKN